MKRTTAYLVASVIFSLILLQYYYYIYLKGTHFKCIYPSDTDLTSRDVNVKNILYWGLLFGHADFNLGFGSKIFEGCEVSNCFATDNRCHLPVDQFDAIFFHGREYSTDVEDKPENRSQNQYYIYLNQESPAFTPKWAGSDNFFNWSMTYRSDSDICYSYGSFQNRTTDYRMPTIEDVQQKPFKIAWMVSNCNAKSNRKELYEKINKHIPVDVYGDCGTKYCDKEDLDGCYDLLAKNYKFYLSFENSFCAEYVTEKTYTVLKRDFIPIVWGGADYEKFAPPNSVIDITKFDTIEELVDYIKVLDEDPEKYLSYFEWKKKYVVREMDLKQALCTLCKKLNEPLAHQSYSNIYEWWSDGMCRMGDNLPNILFT